jgi:hypothetical protein
MGVTRMHSRTVEVWRAVAAQPKGATPGFIRERLRDKYTDVAISSSLKGLRQEEYLVYDGVSQFGFWRITGKVPFGEQLPAWYLDDDRLPDGTCADAEPRDPRSAAEHALCINSVFDLGDRTLAALMASQTEIDTAIAPCEFHLASSGHFAIQSQGARPIVLTPDVTRSMFRFLDRLGGLRLSTKLQRQPKHTPSTTAAKPAFKGAVQ